MSTPLQSLEIRRPDDWHVHLREGAVLMAVAGATARVFGRALVMPNLADPVTTTAKARAYRDAVLAAVPKDCGFTPHMALYLTNDTNAQDLIDGYKDGAILAAKLYPAGATTGSSAGVSDIRALYPLFEKMEKTGIPLSIHGEVVDPDVDTFDREQVFIDRELMPMRARFPGLKIILEHLSTRHAVNYLMAEGPKGTLAATLTPHHLSYNRSALFQGGLNPHLYCIPIVKREQDRLALIRAATSGLPFFFLGTDTAPHPRAAKEGARAKGGVFTAPQAIEIYTQIFDDAGCLDALEAFASVHGAAFYGLPPANQRIRLEKTDTPKDSLKPFLTSDGAQIMPFVPPKPLFWHVAEGQPV